MLGMHGPPPPGVRAIDREDAFRAIMSGLSQGMGISGPHNPGHDSSSASPAGRAQPPGGIRQAEIALREVKSWTYSLCCWCSKPFEGSLEPVTCNDCELVEFCGDGCQRDARSQHERVCTRGAKPHRFGVDEAFQKEHLTFKVAIAGDVECAKKLLEQNRIDVHGKTSSGMQLIHHAVCNGHCDLVKWALEEARCDPEAKNSEGETPLINAAGQPAGVNPDLSKTERGSRALLAARGKKPVNINARHATHAGRDFTALMCAADSGNAGVAKLILQQPGVDVNARSAPADGGERTTAVTCAAGNKHSTEVGSGG